MGKDNIYGPGESFSRGMEIGKTTIFRQNRPVKFRLEMVNGSVVEGIIPANSEFKVTPQIGDIKKFDIFIEDIPKSPQAIE
ncbi:hypothetical protein K9I53_18750 [Klebsiella quasipneumoniae]|uniref:hypothetical protein n=1 Tax=Klebsiella pneumoniae complex TaxID=3390273 RepID=UPI00083C9375|nr:MULTISPECIES: hypothetical protein [Klebsiella]AOE32445.1 hypothetical protein BCV49_19740 [Klebsiella pneumoniae]MCZ9506663.1 hypothetical protein [Klebsiella quasipneumoniae]HCD3586632.1 hypothetical protein [Klebsiella pneumoniae]